MIERRDIPEAEKPDAAVKLALAFLTIPASEENRILEKRCERNRIAEEEDENLRKCKTDIMEALETFFYSGSPPTTSALLLRSQDLVATQSDAGT